MQDKLYALLLLSILVSKYLKNFILIIKNNYVFNIIKTTILESINANLEIQKFKKVNFELRKSNFAIKKKRYNNY